MTKITTENDSREKDHDRLCTRTDCLISNLIRFVSRLLNWTSLESNTLTSYCITRWHRNITIVMLQNHN